MWNRTAGSVSGPFRGPAAAAAARRRPGDSRPLSMSRSAAQSSRSHGPPSLVVVVVVIVVPGGTARLLFALMAAAAVAAAARLAVAMPPTSSTRLLPWHPPAKALVARQEQHGLAPRRRALDEARGEKAAPRRTAARLPSAAGSTAVSADEDEEGADGNAQRS